MRREQNNALFQSAIFPPVLASGDPLALFLRFGVPYSPTLPTYSMPTSTTDTPSSLDKENNVAIDPSKLSLKDRIKYFSEKNKSSGSAPIRGAGAAAAALTLAAAAAASSTTAASVMDLNSSMTSSSSSSRTHALAAKLENKLPLFHAPHLQSVTTATITTAGQHSPHQCISFFAPTAGELGIRLHQAAKDAPIKVEAVDPTGVAALAGIRIGDVLIRAPYSLVGAPADVEDAAREYLNGLRGGVAFDFQRY